MSSASWTNDDVTRNMVTVTEVPSDAKKDKSPLVPVITLSSKSLQPVIPASAPSSSSSFSLALSSSDKIVCNCLMDEEPRYLSLPVGRIQQQQQKPSSLVKQQQQLEQPFTNCSSSCDNLIFGSPSDIGGDGLGRLCKASSDNPIYSSSSPPIPPRDYIPRAQSRPALNQKPQQKPEIHPIVQDGQKRSATHYWLLPDKQKTSSLDAMDMTGQQHYVNIAGNGLWTQKTSKTSLSLGKKKPSDAGKELRKPRASDDVISYSPNYDIYSDKVPLLSDVSSLDSMSVGTPEGASVGLCEEEEEDRATSMGEIHEMIDMVQSKVDGVTVDESFTALATHQWNVEVAIRYLKVENLFRLGLASRDRCRQLLEANNWNLERAASGLLDLIGVESCK